MGTSVVVQWLRLQAPIAGGLGFILSQETRSHTPQLKISYAPVKIEDPACYNEDLVQSNK